VGYRAAFATHVYALATATMIVCKMSRREMIEESVCIRGFAEALPLLRRNLAVL
jgi:hypothetical protein